MTPSQTAIEAAERIVMNYDLDHAKEHLSAIIQSAIDAEHQEIARLDRNHERMANRIRELQSALKELLAVSWPNEDLPDSRTNKAIATAKASLKRK